MKRRGGEGGERRGEGEEEEEKGEEKEEEEKGEGDEEEKGKRAKNDGSRSQGRQPRSGFKHCWLNIPDSYSDHS